MPHAHGAIRDVMRQSRQVESRPVFAKSCPVAGLRWSGGLGRSEARGRSIPFLTPHGWATRTSSEVRSSGDRRLVRLLDSSSSGPCGPSPRKRPSEGSGNRASGGGSYGPRRGRRRKPVAAAARRVGQIGPAARGDRRLVGVLPSRVLLQISMEGVRPQEARSSRIGRVTGGLASCGNSVAGETTS